MYIYTFIYVMQRVLIKFCRVKRFKKDIMSKYYRFFRKWLVLFFSPYLGNTQHLRTSFTWRILQGRRIFMFLLPIMKVCIPNFKSEMTIQGASKYCSNLLVRMFSVLEYKSFFVFSEVAVTVL